MTTEILNQEERTKFINSKLSKLSIHEKLKELNLDDVMMDFAATSLCRSAMYDEKSVYPKIDCGFAFETHMNDIYVEALNNQFSNQEGKESAVLKTKYYNPPYLIFQHLPVKEKVKNIEVNRVRNGYIVDTLTRVEIQEVVKNGGKVIRIYEGVLCRENLKSSLFRKVIGKLFALKQK